MRNEILKHVRFNVSKGSCSLRAQLRNEMLLTFEKERSFQTQTWDNTWVNLKHQRTTSPSQFRAITDSDNLSRAPIRFCFLVKCLLSHHMMFPKVLKTMNFMATKKCESVSKHRGEILISLPMIQKIITYFFTKPFYIKVRLGKSENTQD